MKTQRTHTPEGMEFERTIAALRESEDRYRILFETVCHGIVYQDADGAIISANPAAEHILGLSLDQLQGRKSIDPRWRAIHEDESPFPGETHPAMVALKTGKSVGNVVMGVFNPITQRTVWINICAVPLFNPSQDRPHQVYTTFEDITKRWEAERERRKVEQIFHLFLEHSPIYVFFKDEQIRSLYLSRNYEKMLGRPLREILGRTMDEVFPSDLAKRMIQDDLKVMGGHVPIEVEEELDGRSYYTLKFPVLEDGVPRYLAGFTQDITERRQAEAEVARLRASLAHVSSMSTLVEMAASIAHELNQPLAAIQANASAALHKIRNGSADMEELRTILEDISADDLRIGEIIRRMREPIHRGESAFHTLDLNDLVRDLLGMVRNEAFMAGTTLETDLEDGLPPVRGDRIQLLQILLNLVNNAIDATREREPALRRVIVSTALDSGSKVRVEVLDSGGGIPEGALGRMFEPFFTTKPKGLGLGLPICKALAEAHGGTLSARNHKDGGACFSIVLPSQPRSGNALENL